MYTARLLRRNPILTITATLSLAIGIGANTTIFTVANGLLLQPAAGVAEPSRLVDIGSSGGGAGFGPISYPNYLDSRRRQHGGPLSGDLRQDVLRHRDLEEHAQPL